MLRWWSLVRSLGALKTLKGELIREAKRPKEDFIITDGRGAGETAAPNEHRRVLKGRIKGLYIRGDIYWFAKQANGRRSMVSLETRDYAEAGQRAREILDSPELQPAQTFPAEVERFLKHELDTNRYSKMSAESKRSCLTMFADSVKSVPPTNVTRYHCKAFYLALKKRIAPSTAESYMFTLRLVLQLVRP